MGDDLRDLDTSLASITKLISIVIPVYNEQEVLPMCFERLTTIINSLDNYDFEILLINDGSKDNTYKIIKQQREKDKRYNYITFSRNFGKEIAMLAGIDYATGDAVIFLDADLQDPPELIPQLIKYWEQGYDDVYGRRRRIKGENWLKKFTSKIYYRILQKVTHLEIQRDTGDFRLLDKRCINALRKMREFSRNSKAMFSWIGYNKKEILYDKEPRVAGSTKWSYKKLVDLAIDGILFFTTSPISISIYLGIPAFCCLFLYAIHLIVKYVITKQQIQPVSIIILLVILFGTINIILFGIVGEYIGRIFNETKKRPLYLVDEYNGKKELNELLEEKGGKQ